MSVLFFIPAEKTFAQEPTVGQQNGVTWQNLVVGTPAETTTRKTFYVDGLYDMSVFWSQHAMLRHGAVDYDDAFIGMNVGQIRDGLDSFYSDSNNLQIPIVDAVLIVRLQNAGIPKKKVDQIIAEFKRANQDGMKPGQENKIWKEGLFLLE